MYWAGVMKLPTRCGPFGGAPFGEQARVANIATLGLWTTVAETSPSKLFKAEAKATKIEIRLPCGRGGKPII